MEVVSLRRLGNPKPPSPKKRSVFYLVPRTIVIGLVLAPILIAILTKLGSRANSTHPRPANIPNQATLSANTNYNAQPINPEQLLPESADISSFLANKFLESVPPPTPDCAKSACVALTFDDGPNNDSSPIILTALEKHHVHATFFEIGNKVAGKEQILQIMHNDGNDVGNHSWSHPSFLKLTPDQMKQQIDQTQQAIVAAGVPAPYLFRPPYGNFRLEMENTIKLSVILWNVDPKDWSFDKPDQIAKAVEQQIKPGAIIVMHDKPATAQAVDQILTDLKSKYRFVTVTELLNLNPSSGGAYIGR